MATFTQAEVNRISEMYENIKKRMNEAGTTALNPHDKPMADGYAMMAHLLQDRLHSDSHLSADERQSIQYVMTWFQGAEKVNRGEGAFSTIIRVYSDIQSTLNLLLTHSIIILIYIINLY